MTEAEEKIKCYACTNLVSEHASKCHDCGATACEDHSDNCKDCDEKFCLADMQNWGHVTMCDKCGNAWYGED